MPEINLLMGNFLEVSIYVITSILLILIGFGIGYYAFHKKYEKTGKSAQKIIEDAKRLADENRKNMLVETKQEIYRLKQESEKEIRNLRNEVEREIRERRRIVDDLERKLAQREERLDARSANLDKREEVLNLKEQKNDERKSMLDEQYSKVEELIEEQSKKLLEISGLDIEEARSIILQRVEDEMANEIALLIKDAEDKAKAEVSRKAQSLLANAIQQYASETVSKKQFRWFRSLTMK